MADTKISGLTALTGAGTATGDLIPLDDVSATTTKSITVAQLIVALQALGIGTGLGASTVTTLGIADDTTITEAKNIVVGTATGTKIGTATTQKLGFFNSTPVVQPSTLTQTYSTADATLVGLTSGTLTDSSGGTSGGATVAAIVGAVDPTAATLASTANAVATLTAQINKLVADHADLAQFVNSAVDKLQTLGLLS